LIYFINFIRGYLILCLPPMDIYGKRDLKLYYPLFSFKWAWQKSHTFFLFQIGKSPRKGIKIHNVTMLQVLTLLHSLIFINSSNIRKISNFIITFSSFIRSWESSYKNPPKSKWFKVASQVASIVKGIKAAFCYRFFHFLSIYSNKTSYTIWPTLYRFLNGFHYPSFKVIYYLNHYAQPKTKI
jgi:hypothetical protein